MIPISLRLRNFISYGSNVPQLNFSSFHTACLSGDNGHGKSALLDAITWALWGQARGVDRNGNGMDDLIFQGAEEMEVEFTFALEGNFYRVIRKRNKSRSQSVLELHLINKDKAVSLTCNKIADTQNKILQILKMDFETFTNSAFLLQGKVDAFTTQKPNERKRILGEILGLSYYERLERKARDKMNAVVQEIDLLKKEIEQIDAELTNKQAYQSQLHETEQEIASLKEKIAELEAGLKVLLNKREQLTALRTKAKDAERRLNQGKQELEELTKQIARIKERISQNRLILSQEQAITAGYQKLQQALAANEELQSKGMALLELQQQQNYLEKNINNKRQTVEVQLAALKEQLKQLEEKVEKSNLLTQEARELEYHLEQLKSFEEEKNLIQEQVNKNQADILSAQEIINKLNEDLQNLRERYQVLNKPVGECPLCGSDLGHGTRERILQNFTTEGLALKQKVESYSNQIKAKEMTVKQLLLRLSEIEAQLKPKEHVQNRLAVIRQELKDTTDAAEKISSISNEINLKQQVLTNNIFASEEQKQLEDIKLAIARLDYSKTTHDQILRQVQELKVYHEQFHRLQLAKEAIKTDDEHLGELEKSCTLREQAITTDQELLTIIAGQLEHLPQVMTDISSQEQSLSENRDMVSVLEQRKGGLLSKLSNCQQLEQLKTVNKAKLEELYYEKGIYEELVFAFGKKGLQAIIIENAIPEIQAEANRLLARMTDSRMSVALITQKETKKGNITETLDIRISDERGTRKYELFSGGEAFRVNFALRIALSKLLARRAGAKLQTLVIDEGFGTQDGKGRERLIEVINAVSRDFQKILVITHIQELKDAFPVQIEIVKTDKGSTLRFV